MRLLLSILILACSLSAYGAAGVTNLIGLEVLDNGWQLRVTLGGNVLTSFGTNCQFFNGFRSNNTPSPTNMLALSVLSPGFTDLGASQQVARTIYATRLLRQPYPMQNTNQCYAQDVVAGTNVVSILALSDYIFSQDTLTATALPGYIVNTNTPQDAAGFTGASVTNSSTQTYQPVIANWSWPGWQRITGNTFQVRCVAFHSSGQAGRPVRAVRFVAQSNNGTPSTNWVTSAIIDKSIGDAVPVVEYVGTLDCSTMTNGSLIRCDFTAYPWVGTTNLAVTDTFDNKQFQPSGDYASITNVCDRTGAYGIAYAVVAATNNSGSAGVVSQTFNSSTPPLAFDTIAHAQSAMAASNVIWFNRNDCGAGWIYCRGSNQWTGAGTPAGNIPNTWVNIAGYPGEPLLGSWIWQQSDNNILKGREKFSGLYLSNTAAVLVYSATASHSSWFDQCQIYLTGGAAMDTATFYVTRCTVDQFTQGFRPPAGDSSIPALVRGNVLSNAANNTAYCMIGNLRLTNATTASFPFALAAILPQTPRSAKLPILAFNKVMGANALCLSDSTGALSNKLGFAIVQNLFEFSGNSTYAGTVFEGDFRSATNFVIWNNSTIGQRWNYCYNSVNDSNPVFFAFSLKGDHFTTIANKSDTFTTANGARIGNWAVVNGVGASGNTITGTTNIQSISFPFEFAGLNSYTPPIAGNLNRVGFYRFTGYASYDGATVGSGYGNYRLLSDSPGFRQSIDWLLPYDIEGAPRSAIDPPGAYVSGNVRKGVFF